MEGRAHPVAEKNEASDALKPPKSPPAPSAPSMPEKTETYIVQIPRDQIYRVPPPENSKIVESYRTLPGKQKKGSGCGWLLKAIIITLLLLAIGCGITLLVFNTFYKPIAPTFSITNIDVKNSTKPHSTQATPSYDISLKVENPNERMGISYGDGGTTSISYEGRIIGEGKYPIESQDAKELTNVQLTLAGLKAELPAKLDKSMKDKESKTPAELSLAINVPIKLKAGISFTKILKITCHFKVNTLAMDTKISSQDCNSEI